jgi:hypothetical protein
MRIISILAVLAAAQIGAAWAIGDVNVARPGGAFATLEAESAGSCERLCVEDTLCMAWSFKDGLCELKAVVPAAIAQNGVISGISSRVPVSLRAQRPLRESTAIEALPAPSQVAAVEADAQLIEATAEDDISDQLLGGLEGDEDLRTRLGN